ncbi:hypothetical protein DRJ16_02810, partial [Candidatus Woesearchaeota archaeon]
MKVEDEKRKFILRIYDFKPESLLTPAEIAMVSEKVGKGEKIFLFDKGLRLYDTALCTILCQIDRNGYVHGPTSVPSLFTIVEELDDNDLSQLNLDTGDLHIGWVRVGHRITPIKVSLHGSKTIPHHILVCGVTGAGKSNLGKVLAASIMITDQPRYSLVLFDCESEYFNGGDVGHLGLAHLPHAERRLFYVSQDVDEPTRLEFTFRVDGIELTRTITAHPLLVNYNDLTPSDFAMTGEFTGPQEELLWLAYKHFEENWLATLVNSPVQDLYRRLRRLVSVNTINVTKRKIKYMLGKGEIFREDVEYDLLSAILGAVSEGKVVLVDIPHATEGEEKLLSATVARRIFKTYERLKKDLPDIWNKLPYVLIMVEEAHRYLAKQNLTSSGEIRENIFSI